MTYYAHASAGCLHIRPLINIKLSAELDKMKAISTFVAKLLGDLWRRAVRASMATGARSWLNESFYGRDLYALFKQVKQAFDPQNRFNPGNIVDARPIDAHLRMGRPTQHRTARSNCTSNAAWRTKSRCVTAPPFAAS